MNPNEETPPRAAALIVAAGRGIRAGGEIPKQYQPIAGKSVIARAVAAFLDHPRIGHVHLVISDDDRELAVDALGTLMARVTLGRGGDSRQASVRAGLEQMVDTGCELVLVHDAARPLVPAPMIDRVLDALADSPGASPALPVVDSIRRGTEWIEEVVPRDGLWRVQTPQGFHFNALLDAHRTASEDATDDAEIFRAAGLAVRIVDGDERAMKITGPADFALAERMMDQASVTGSGFDVHRFGPGDHVWLCGIAVPHTQGLIGHSDADAGLHALTDAILGAIGDGDIGAHFPPSDPRWKGAASDRFLAHAADLVAAAGGRILHCDVTLICERPKIGPHRDAMVARIADILSAHTPRVSVKATTTEGLGFTGRGEGIAAQAVATVRLPIGGSI